MSGCHFSLPHIIREYNFYICNINFFAITIPNKTFCFFSYLLLLTGDLLLFTHLPTDVEHLTVSHSMTSPTVLHWGCQTAVPGSRIGPTRALPRNHLKYGIQNNIFLIHLVSPIPNSTSNLVQLEIMSPCSRQGQGVLGRSLVTHYLVSEMLAIRQNTFIHLSLLW